MIDAISDIIEQNEGGNRTREAGRNYRRKEMEEKVSAYI